MSFTSWLVFLYDMQWGEFRFMHKRVVGTSIPEETWNTPFQLSSVPNFAFEFFMWTQKFWNPKHPDMGWIGKFFRRDAKDKPAWLGSTSTLTGATYPPKIYYRRSDQKKESYSEAFLCLCGNIYNFSQFFWLSICLLREFYAPIDQSEVRRLQAICPLENCAQTQVWGALAAAPLQLQSPSLGQCLPTHSSALLQASQDFCQWALFSSRTNLSSTDKATSGSLIFDKEFAPQHVIKNFISRPSSPNAFHCRAHRSIFTLNAPMKQDI